MVASAGDTGLRFVFQIWSWAGSHRGDFRIVPEQSEGAWNGRQRHVVHSYGGGQLKGIFYYNFY